MLLKERDASVHHVLIVLKGVCDHCEPVTDQHTDLTVNKE